MPDGRFISRCISQNLQLAGVSLAADFLFGRCIPHLDRDGRMLGDPRQVRAVVCPFRSEFTDETVADLLRELGTATPDDPLLLWYEVDGKAFLQFPGFFNHQRGRKYDREADSRYPSYDHPRSIDKIRPEHRPRLEVVPSGSGSGPDQNGSRSAKGEVQAEAEGEGEGKPPRRPPEGADRDVAAKGGRKPAVEYTPEFLDGWCALPARDGPNDKSRAFKAWRARLAEGVPAAEMIAGAVRYATWCDHRRKSGTEYVMQAATFFGPGHHWEGDYRLLDEAI